MLNVQQYREQIVAACKQMRVKELHLFGSALGEDFGPESDIDVLVTFDGDDELFDRYMSLKSELEAIFDRPVDVVMEAAIRNPYFRQAVDANRMPLYAA